MSLSDDIALLSALPVFAGFEQAALRRLAQSAQTRNIRTGEVLYRQGEPAEGGYVLVSGSLSLQDADGRRRQVSPGSLLGEPALVIETQWLTTAVADEDSAVLRLSRALMGRVIQEFPHSAAALQQALAVPFRRLSMELDVVSRLLQSAQGALEQGTLEPASGAVADEQADDDASRS
ncbi:cyclic nucleotide-binding domain-containing protein [Pseudochelatococcus contaminans]|uniref:CRP-like cAMP-binding protein n=1 Tax=Pseudochelatococcus contaminans TaxID=1538103 RepID=A0A7W6EFI8_9HYPH|nr:cyclic nucleotide-binding domain-containing protein [Pseudochelatococcus contaminans]MBB3808879.1 CRP-like cAMP-binding protein [Pseudochelatococcus contaminans]